MSVEQLIQDKQKRFLEAEERQQTEGLDKKHDVYQRVRQRISENRDLFVSGLNQDLEYIRNMIWRIIEDEMEFNRREWTLNSYERAEILEQLMHTMFGYGILENLIHDPSVTEIMVNGLSKIFIEKDGKFHIARDRRGVPLKFNNNEELMHVIEKIVSPINRKVNESEPIVDARLPDGSRVNAVLHPIALDGSTLTIRKFPQKPYTMNQLVEFGTLDKELADFLKKLVYARYNIIISGGTGSGKTTFLNALSMFIPSNSRVITIEDAAELKLLEAENLIRLETRPPNMEGKGEIRMRDLVRTALRMRPDRIVVGEVRSGEALDMLQAMNTGHDGSLSTGHANSAVDMLSRLETMVLMAGLELPVAAIRKQIASSIDIIVHLSKQRNGKRRVVEVIEITGIQQGEIQTQSLYEWDEILQKVRTTGNKMRDMEKFVGAGLAMDWKGGETIEETGEYVG
ncbi:CpaF family protein [Paenibacillus koleovorans]|uniref:CpaF family protein n=1 Tax=Paenibacillus koleovorans TaxID=121608 RepID=UPI000FD91A6A|nr:CpaF family protein [Paenibacillus koleovorans]